MTAVKWEEMLAQLATNDLSGQAANSWNKGSEKNKKELGKKMMPLIPGNLAHLVTAGGEKPQYDYQTAGSVIQLVHGDAR